MNSAISIKFKHAAETRRITVAASFDAIVTTVKTLFNLEPSAVKLSYVDADGDAITFSSDVELAEAVAQLRDAASVLTVHVAAAAATAPQAGLPNVWLQLPVWVRNRVVANNLPGANVNDPTVWDRLTPETRERVHSKFVQKFAQKKDAAMAPAVHVVVTSDGPKASDAKPEASVSPLSDQELWASSPVWFKAKIVGKFAPGANPDDVATFAALPEPVKMRVRCRVAKWQNCHAKWAAKNAAKEAKAAAAAEPVSEEADRAMWAALPAWIRFKVASKSAKKGAVVTDVHAFETFQQLPPLVQQKVRAKAGKCQKWMSRHATDDSSHCGRGRGGWWRSAQSSATSSATAATPQPASTFSFGQR